MAQAISPGKAVAANDGSCADRVSDDFFGFESVYPVPCLANVIKLHLQNDLHLLDIAMIEHFSFLATPSNAGCTQTASEKDSTQRPTRRKCNVTIEF